MIHVQPRSRGALENLLPSGCVCVCVCLRAMGSHAPEQKWPGKSRKREAQLQSSGVPPGKGIDARLKDKDPCLIFVQKETRLKYCQEFLALTHPACVAKGSRNSIKRLAG